MRVAVIGKGTAAIVTTLQLLKNNHEVTIVYDPDVDPINVGESSTPNFVHLLYDSIRVTLNDLVTEGIFSYKSGINFVDWSDGKQFYHNFFNQRVAVHFETKTFNQYIHNFLETNGLVEYIEQRVEKIDYDFLDYKVKLNGQLTYDFVVNCTGWGDDNDYEEPIIETVNSCILFKKDYKEYSNHHTLHLATEDGWQFGLPFPSQKTFKCGYLFNDKFTSKEQALERVNSIGGVEIYEYFSWTPRYSSQLIKNFFLATNGNRLFFLEPLQALSLHYYIWFSEIICQFLDKRSAYELDRLNSTYENGMYEKQMSLAYHYQYGSMYDSPYWNNVRERSRLLIDASRWGTGEKFYRKVRTDKKYNLQDRNSLSKLGIFEWEDHEYILKGMTRDYNRGG